MNDKVTVSVIVPIYNCAKWIRKCVDSILKQDLKEIEVICVNDGSKDESGRICDEYARRDSRVRVIHRENGGASAARNSGLNAANGEWISFVDADDWIEPEMLRSMVDMARNEDDIVICASTVSYPDGHEKLAAHLGENQFWDRTRIEREQRKFLIMSIKELQGQPRVSHGPVWAKMYRKSLICDHQLRFAENVKRTEDGIFNMYAFECSRSIVYLDRPLYHYSVFPGSISHTYYKDIVPCTEQDYFEVRRFALRYKKHDEVFQKGINIRITTWFYKYLAYEFFTPQYIHEHGYWKARSAVDEIRCRKEYREAFRDVDVSLLTKEQRVFVLLVKMRAWELLFSAVRIKQRRRRFA